MYSWRGKVELMPSFEEKDGRVIMSAERFAITPNDGAKEATMAQDNERPPLTAEAFDAMMEDIQRARRSHASLVVDAGHDRRLAAELSLEILKAQSMVVEDRVCATVCGELFAREQNAPLACLPHLGHCSIKELIISTGL